jgi:hypothetical protein
LFISVSVRLCFSAVSASLLLCFSATFLLPYRFSVFSAFPCFFPSLLFCFSAFPYFFASLLLIFSASLYFPVLLLCFSASLLSLLPRFSAVLLLAAFSLLRLQ